MKLVDPRTPFTMFAQDAWEHVFDKVTEDRDLNAVTLTCTALFETCSLPHIQWRISGIRIRNLCFNDESKQLLLALDKRSLRDEEISRSDNTSHQKEPQGATENAQKLTDAFYETFTQRCCQLNHTQFTSAIEVVYDELRERIGDLDRTSFTSWHGLSIKVHTLSLDMTEKVLHDMIRDYSVQVIEGRLDRESALEQINRLFPRRPWIIERYLDEAMQKIT